MLLPTHYEPRRARTNVPAPSKAGAKSDSTTRSKGGEGHIRLGPGDVWDEREDDLNVFGIGSEGESEDEGRRVVRSSRESGQRSMAQPIGPTIVVSGH